MHASRWHGSHRHRSRRLAVLAVTTAAALVAIGGSSAAYAATPPVGAFPTWTSSAPGTFDATFPAATAMPAATVVTDDTSASVAAGASAFLGASTGFGSTFGSSRKQPYLTVGSLAGFTPSTTTITFPAATPVGWGFALGDIDADYVSLAATGPSGPLTPAQFGAQDTSGTPALNYCLDASPRPGSCSTLGAPYTDFPLWCEGTPSDAPECAGKPVASLVGHGIASDGSYGWFVPTVPITSITLTFTPILGFPNYQIWLVAPSPAATVTGDVGGNPGDVIPSGTQVTLMDVAGVPVTDILDEPVVIPVQPDGTFSFETAFGEYQLGLINPPGSPLSGEGFPFVFSANADTITIAEIQPAQLAPTGIQPSVPLFTALLLLATGALIIVARRTADTTTSDA